MLEAWTGDWRKRISERIQALGFESVTDCIEAFPIDSLITIAHRLGKEDIAADQVLRMYRDEARAAGPDAYARFARSCLARLIIEMMPKGWGNSVSKEMVVLGEWGTDVAEVDDLAPERVIDALETLAPVGWLPVGMDDPILVEAFRQWAAPT